MNEALSRGLPTPNERVTFGILHEDADLLVVTKPGGIVTQPGVGHEHDTLLNGLFARYGERLAQVGQRRDYGLVHRLDRETSGVLAVALSVRAYDGLRALFEAREIRKFYWAACIKGPREDDGVVKRAIAEKVRRLDKYRSEKTAQLIRAGGASGGGKAAITAWRVLQRTDLGALIEARPVTGRLHQVRVHLASIGAPVAGDAVYGPNHAEAASKRLALHAHRLSFEHPITGEAIDARAPWPRDLTNVLKRMDLDKPIEGR